MKELQPLVSVLMTAYNREKYIAEAIESVLNSTYTNFELIIVDDGSFDNTVSVAKEFERKDSRIRVYLNEKNLGDYPNRNKAAAYAKGKYLKYLDSDDKLYTDGLEYCVTNLEQFPAAGIAMQWAYKGDSHINARCFDPAMIINEHFFKKQYLIIGPSGTIIRKSTFAEIGGYDTRFGVASDMYFNLKIASKASVVLLPKSFFFYREHTEQEKNNNFDYLYNNYLYMKSAIEELGLPLDKKQLKWLSDKNKRRFLVNISSYLLKTKKINKTKEALSKTGFGWNDVFSSIFH